MLVLFEALMLLVFIFNVITIIKYEKYLNKYKSLPSSLIGDTRNAIANRVYVNFLLLILIIALPISTIL